jgi:hypothetical protein
MATRWADISYWLKFGSIKVQLWFKSVSLVSAFVSRNFGSTPYGSVYMQWNGRTGVHQPKDIMHRGIHYTVTHAQRKNVIFYDDSMKSLHRACLLISLSPLKCQVK